MFVPLRHNFPDWKATARAIFATILVHADLVFAAPTEAFSSLAPIACAIMAPLLLAGLSKPLDPAGQEANDDPGEGQAADKVSTEPTLSTTKAWTIDSTLLYSSSKIRCLDLRVLLLGLCVTLFDVLCNQYQDEMSVTRWPISAVVSIFVTLIWLYLENSVPRSRDLQPGFLCLAAAALVGIFSHFNFLDAFGLYDDELDDGSLAHAMPVPENASHSKPIMIASWYTTLISMVVFNRQLVHQKADQALPLRMGSLLRRTIYSSAFMSRRHRSTLHGNSEILMSPSPSCFTKLASCVGASWPLDMNTTVTGLLLFALIVSFQLRPRSNNLDEKTSLFYVAALGFSALMTILAVGLNRHGVLYDRVSDPKIDWKVGSWSALVFYQLLVTASLRLQETGCLRDGVMWKRRQQGLCRTRRKPWRRRERNREF